MKPVAQISFSVAFSVACLSATALQARTSSGVGTPCARARDPFTCQSRAAAPTAGTREAICALRHGRHRRRRKSECRADQPGDAEISPQAFLYQQDSAKDKIDVRAPVMDDIHGGYKSYQCGKPLSQSPWASSSAPRPAPADSYGENGARRLLQGYLRGLEPLSGRQPPGIRQHGHGREGTRRSLTQVFVRRAETRRRGKCG